MGVALLIFEAAKTLAHYPVDSELVVAATGLMTVPLFAPLPRSEDR